MGGGGGKKDLARDLLFSALDSVCRAVPSGAMNVSGGILVRPPSEGGSETYLLAVQRSLSDALSSQLSQWSFFDDSMSLAYSFVVVRCRSWLSWSERPLQRWLAFMSLFFFLRRSVRAGDHHLLVKGSGDDIGTVASIESLIKALRESRARRRLSGEVMCLRAGKLSRLLVRWLVKSSQLVALKL